MIPRSSGHIYLSHPVLSPSLSPVGFGDLLQFLYACAFPVPRTVPKTQQEVREFAE